MEGSSDNSFNETANEASRQQTNSEAEIPAGVDNLERNINDATSRYADMDFPDRGDEASVD